MNLTDLQKLDGRGAFVALAKKANTSPSYLSQCAGGHRKPSPSLAKKLVAADARLTLASLRPDVYGRAA